MNNMKLDHISYAVRSTEEAIKAFSICYDKIDVNKYLEKDQNVYITYLSNDQSDHRIELVEPAGTPNPVEGMLQRSPSVLYHVCYRVSNFSEAADQLKKNGFYMVTAPFKTSFEIGVRASHFYNQHWGLIEIIGKR